MPSEEDENEQSNLLELCITKDCLLQELRSNPSRLIILDCRSSDEFGESHIRNAVNFSIPSIMLRRLAAGKIDLTSTIKCRDLKEKIVNGYKENLFVIYSDSYITDKLFQKNSFTAGDTIHVLAKRLLKDGCRVVCLEDGFGPFRASYPEWCESCSDTATTSESERDPSGMAMPLMGLRSLRISAWRSSGNRSLGGGESSGTFSADESSPSDSADERCDSSLGLDDDRDFPVEILPHLYLGNAANSVDAESLDKYGIQYILNVTPDLPNVFEERIKYMNIPITDHWSQNLASFFPKAIEFIDDARGQKKGVLVHCLAGVSRSVTVTVAYLMARHQLSLNDAFCLVRARKSNIAPNFHFMEQLHTFERQLNDANATPHSTSRSPAAVRCEACGLVEAADTCRKCCNSPDRQRPPPASSARQRPPPPPGSSTTSTSSSSSSTFLSPLKVIGQSPDSGIEFDRWNESSPAPNE